MLNYTLVYYKAACGVGRDYDCRMQINYPQHSCYSAFEIVEYEEEEADGLVKAWANYEKEPDAEVHILINGIDGKDVWIRDDFRGLEGKELTQHRFNKKVARLYKELEEKKDIIVLERNAAAEEAAKVKAKAAAQVEATRIEKKERAELARLQAKFPGS